MGETVIMDTTVVYAIDDNYAMQAGVSLASLLENNRSTDFDILILSDNLNDANKRRLKKTVESHDRSIEFIEIYDMEKRVGVCLALNSWGRTAYCRLFLSELIPEGIEKIIYFDADTLVPGSIAGLIEVLNSETFMDYYAAGCKDATSKYKKMHGFYKNETYYNTGVLLINLKLWREKDVLQTIINEIRRRNGKSIEPDQSYMNCIMINKILTLPAKFNVMSLYYNDYDTYLQMSGYSKSEAYSREVLTDATTMPVIVHFAGDKEYRPWYADCKHRMKAQWMEYLQKTEWKDFNPSENAPRDDLSFIKRFKMKIVRGAIRYGLLAKFYVRYKYGFTVKLFRQDYHSHDKGENIRYG